MLGPMTKPDHSDSLADWSLWFPFVEAVAVAPRLPGVYMAKDSAQVVYVGMAAERRGQGIRGRLTVYREVARQSLDWARPRWTVLCATLTGFAHVSKRLRRALTGALVTGPRRLWSAPNSSCAGPPPPLAMPRASLSAQSSMRSRTSICGTALDSAGRLSDVRLRVLLRRTAPAREVRV
jgi:hypothetical protein